MPNYKEFEMWLFRKDRHETTIKKHIQRLRHIASETSNIDPQEIERFIFDKKCSGVSNATLNSYIDTIRCYGSFTCDDSLKAINHFKTTPKIKGVINFDELNGLLYQKPIKIRERATWDLWTLFFECVAYTGARPGEIANLKVESVDLGRKVFEVHHTKTGKPRLIPVPPNIFDKVSAHVKKVGSGYLFVGRKGVVFSDKTWGRQFKKRKEMCGINRSNVTCYSLRHSFITSLLNEDVNIHKIAKLVGHDIKQTQRYEHLTTKDIHKAVTRHPVVRKGSDPEILLNDIYEILSEYSLDKRFVTVLERTNGGVKFEIKLLT